jgi:hypothetical protein
MVQLALTGGAICGCRVFRRVLEGPVLSRNAIVAAAALAVCALAASPAFAAETFAQNMQLNQNDTVHFSDNGNGTSTLASVPGSIVEFSFTSPFFPALLSQHAIFSLSALAVHPSVEVGGTLLQAIATGDFSFTRTTPFGGGTNLLSAHFTNAIITGSTNGTTATFLASQPGGSSTVTFTSDFLNFSGSNDRGFSFSFSGINPSLPPNGGTLLPDWSGDATGTFSVDIATQRTLVPEPGSWALLIMGFGGAGAMLRLKRRTLAVIRA